MIHNSATISRRQLLAATAGGLLAAPHIARAAPVTIEFWDMIWGPQEYIDAARRLVDRFNAQTPAIQVRYRSIPWANWYQTFVTAVSANSAPDISSGGGFQAVQLYDMGAILPIDDVIADLRNSGEADDFVPGTIDRLRYDNHTVALPTAVDIRVWFYRKDWFQAAGRKPPTTWAEFREAARAMNTNDHAGLVGSGDTGGSHYIFSAMLNNGGGFFTADRKLDFINPRNREALQFLADLANDGSFSPASAGYSSIDRRKAFIQGQAAFILDTPGLPDQAPELAGTIGVLSPIAGLHGDQGTVSWVNNVMLYQQSKRPEETKQFLKWWSRNAKSLWTDGHCTSVPVRKSIAQDDYFRRSDTRYDVLTEYIPIGHVTADHASGIFPQLNELEGDGVMQDLIQDILQKKNLDAAIGRAQARLKDMMTT
jgi:multiple sugar transport system substrate-binding protein